MKKDLWKKITRVFLCFLLTGSVVSCVGTKQPLPEETSPRAKRAAFIRDMEDPAKKDLLIRTLANDPDPVIRQRVLTERFTRDGDKAFDALLQRVKETDLYVMRTLLDCAKHLKDSQKRTELLARIDAENPLDEFRRMARQANFPFHRETVRLKDDPSHDFAVETVKSILLPTKGWLFITDPAMSGHLQGFYKNDFVTSNWKKINMGVWETQGFPGYDGIAWYKIRFKMPPKMECNSVEIKFEAVDESTWVWLNGTYVGQHDRGPEGWDKTFYLDIRKEIKWGQENILTVRVKDTAGAGGIYMPVSIEILR